MKVVFTQHAHRKFKFLKELGWNFKPQDIKKSLENPTNIKSAHGGRKIALSPISKTHNLFIVYSQEGDIITIITFYPVKKGRYD